jgi:hypothetical protein
MLIGPVRRTALLTTVTAAILILVGVAAPALASSASAGAVTTMASAQSASLADSVTTYTFTFNPTATNLDGDGTTAAIPLPPVITCTAEAVTPRFSALNFNNIIATGRAFCDSPVLSIEIILILRRDGAVADSDTLPPTGLTSSESKSVLTPCIDDGFYTLEASMFFIVPVGYTPNPLVLNPVSNRALLVCA